MHLCRTENSKKGLTFRRICGIIYKSPRDGDTTAKGKKRKRNWSEFENGLESFRKKLEKSFENLLTNFRKSGIINKLSRRTKTASSTLKIEQCNQRETLEDSVFTEETR